MHQATTGKFLTRAKERERVNFAAAVAFLLVASSFFISLVVTSMQPGKQPEIKAPSAWQSHLKPAVLPANFSPRVKEIIYVPLYSHIYEEDSAHKMQLAGTVSIRNTDFKNDIIIKSIAYFSTDGKLLQELCDTPLTLSPMATAEIIVPRTNTTGGSGANFVVEWMAGQRVTAPITEAVMISCGSSQAISFVSRGTVITHEETAAEADTRQARLRHRRTSHATATASAIAVSKTI